MNSLPHSKRSQYGGLKYSYPWAFQRLLYTLDNTPDLLSAPSQPSKPLEKLETPPRKLPSLSSQLLTGDQLMDLSPEALRKHFEGRVIRGLCNAHQVRRAGLRHISSAPEISRKQKKQKEQKAHGTHAERRPETAGQTDALTLSLTRDRNAGGRVFHKDSSWEKWDSWGNVPCCPMWRNLGAHYQNTSGGRWRRKRKPCIPSP